MCVVNYARCRCSVAVSPQLAAPCRRNEERAHVEPQNREKAAQVVMVEEGNANADALPEWYCRTHTD